MTKKKLPVRFTGQHFTIDKVLIKDAIRQANISNQDTVLDIGAGKGFLTVHLPNFRKRMKSEIAMHFLVSLLSLHCV
ncbi:rRNA adenine N-6-methyltransferase family protein, partial [Bacteroides uniformis]